MGRDKIFRYGCLSFSVLLALLTIALLFWPLLFSDRTAVLFGLYVVFFGVLSVLIFSKELKFWFFWPLYFVCICTLVGLVLWPLFHHGFSVYLVLLYALWIICCALFFGFVFCWKGTKLNK